MLSQWTPICDIYHTPRCQEMFTLAWITIGGRFSEVGNIGQCNGAQVPEISQTGQYHDFIRSIFMWLSGYITPNLCFDRVLVCSQDPQEPLQDPSRTPHQHVCATDCLCSTRVLASRHCCGQDKTGPGHPAGYCVNVN
jgi:hypothetical protein